MKVGSKMFAFSKIFKNNLKAQCDNNLSLKYLKEIIKFNTNNKKIDPMEKPFEYYYIYDGIIKFESINKGLIKYVPLKTIKFIEKNHYGYYVWSADYDEYKQVYKSVNIFYKFLDTELSKVYELLKVENDNPLYNHVLIKFEMTFLTILNTLKDSIEINEVITEEISTTAIELLQQFIDKIYEILNNKNELNILEKNAMNENLKNRLAFELEFQKKCS